MKKITVIGAGIIDVLAGPVGPEVFQEGSQTMEGVNLSFGGDALNEAVVLSRLGGQVELISTLGKDEAGKRVLDYLKEAGVSTEKVILKDDLSTSVNVVLVDKNGERYFLTDPEGSLRKLSEEDIVKGLDDAGCIISFASLFVSYLLGLSEMERIFKKIKSQPDRTLLVDLTNAKNGETLEDLKPILPYIDFFLPNDEETALLTGISDVKGNARLLVEAGVGCAVIKAGKKGCYLYNGKESLEIPAYPIKKVVDTTGAGDNFAAGFLWALSQGYSLKECGMFGNAVASCAIEVMGAVDGTKSLEEPMKRYQYLRELEEGRK